MEESVHLYHPDFYLACSVFFFIFMYLAVLGLSCDMQDLQSSLWHAGSLVVACKLSCDMWDLVP